MSFGEQFLTFLTFNLGHLRCAILIVFMVFIQGKYCRSSDGGVMVFHYCTAIKGIAAVHFRYVLTQ